MKNLFTRFVAGALVVALPAFTIGLVKTTGKAVVKSPGVVIASSVRHARETAADVVPAGARTSSHDRKAEPDRNNSGNPKRKTNPPRKTAASPWAIYPISATWLAVIVIGFIVFKKAGRGYVASLIDALHLWSISIVIFFGLAIVTMLFDSAVTMMAVLYPFVTAFIFYRMAEKASDGERELSCPRSRDGRIVLSLSPSGSDAGNPFS